MNVLILSAGTRNLIVRCFKSAVQGNGKIVATDMQKTAPAIYDADAYYIVPRITAPGYIDCILEICKTEKIDAVLSLIDPELELIAKNADRFAAVGALVIGSSPELCDLALNKMKMFHWLSEHGYYCARSYDDIGAFYADLEGGKIDFPVFVKPICGSASLFAKKVSDRDMLDAMFASQKDMMIQEFLNGTEIGADVYIDMISGEPVSIFTKKKILMKAGETDKAVSFKDPKLFALIDRFVAGLGWRGQIDIDLFEIDGVYYISEVNPRFGGGYPHAYGCGCDHMKLILNNVMGKANERAIGNYAEGIYMMKYSEVLVREL